MAFTKVRGRGVTTTDNYTVGVITATKFVGPITGGGGGIQVGLLTATALDINGDADISGNLTVGGDFTTLNTTLREVELLHVDANSSATAGIITQRGSGDILNLFDTTTEVMTVVDGGKVGIGKTNPTEKFEVSGTIGLLGGGSYKIDTHPLVSYSSFVLGGGNYACRLGSTGTSTIRHTQIYAGGVHRATFDGVNNRLGIGITNPATKTQIHGGDATLLITGNTAVGSAANTGGTIALGGIYHSNGSITGWAQIKGFKDNNTSNNYNGYLSFTTRDTTDGYVERLRITSAGKVGIGTDVPLGTLDIFNANADASNTNSLGAQINAAWIRIGDVDSAGKTFSNGLGTKLYNQGTAHWSYGMLGQDFLITNTSGDGNKLFPSNRSTHFFIKSDGKVGIGTESPGVELEIKGTAATLLRLDSSNAQGTSFRIRNSGTDKMYMGLAGDFITGQSGNVTDSAIRASGALLVSTGGGTERLRITSGGSLQVKGDVNPNAVFDRGSANTTNVNFNYNGTLTGQLGAADEEFQISAAGSSTPLVAYVNGDERLRITSNGHALLGGTATVDDLTGGAGQKGLVIGSTGMGNAGIAIINSTTGAGRIYFGDNTGAHADRKRGQICYYHNDGSNSDYMAFVTAAGERLRITSDGHILPGASGTQNLGSTSKEWGDLYFANSKGLKLGSSQVGDLYNDGTDTYIRNSVSNGQTLIRSGGNIWISDYAGNHRAAFRDNSAVDLYFDIENHSTAKLSTTATGISVHGEVAASQDYPNFRPTLDFNFTAVKKLDTRITYHRTGPASYTDKFGIVKVVGADVPRFDHYPETGECKGLLIEEARTSRLTQSTGNDSYSHFRQTDRGETIKGPDGVENSAREYTVNSNGSTGGSTTIWGSEAMGFASATSVSCFLKITRGTTMAFRLYDNNNNLESEKITISGGYITDGSYATVVQSDPGSTEGTTTYELYPNGWVRLKWYGASGSANSTSYLQLYIYDHAAANSDGDNIGYAVWGFQVENGSHCTSVIPKPTTATVTRGSDDLVIDGSDFTDFNNKSEGTILADYKVIGGHPEIMYMSNGNSNCRIGLYEAGSSQTRFLVNNAGTLADTTDSSGTTVGDNIKSAGAYKLNDVAASKNGVISSTDSSVTIPTGVDRAYIGGYYNGDVQGSLGLRRLVYYPKRLPNSQLVTLTS